MSSVNNGNHAPGIPMAILPPHHLFNLRMILRRANERYQQVANSFRHNLQLSHHARNLASAKGLTVDVGRAVRCPQSQVSIKPLPLITASCSPTLEDMPPLSIAQRPVIPRIVIPAPTSTRRLPSVPVPSDASEREARVIRTPAKLVAPVALRGQGNPWRGPTSKFSPLTPNDGLSCQIQIQVWDSNKPVVPDVPTDMVVEADDDITSGSSEASSSGPATPNDCSSLMILKRKSFDVDEELETAEKRPKYIRKEWVSLATQNRGA